MPSMLKSAWIVTIAALVCVITVEVSSRAGDCEVSQTTSPIVTPCDDCAVGLYSVWKCDTDPSPANEECGGSTNQDGIVCSTDGMQCDGVPTTYPTWGYCILDVGGTVQEEETCDTWYDTADTQDEGDEPVCPAP